MDRELKILVDAVSRGAIKDNRTALKIIHDALQSNLNEERDLYTKVTEARSQCHGWLEKLQQMVIEQERSMDTLITIMAATTSQLREVDSMMSDNAP